MSKNILKTAGLFSALVLGGYFASAQTAAPSQVPAGDEQAKAEWIKQHPQEYREMGGQNVEKAPRVIPATLVSPERPANDPNRVENLNKEVVKQDDFNSLNPERQKHILAHPELYTIEPSTK